MAQAWRLKGHCHQSLWMTSMLKYPLKINKALPHLNFYRHHRCLFNVGSHTLLNPSLPLHALPVIGSFISHFLFFYLMSMSKLLIPFASCKRKKTVRDWYIISFIRAVSIWLSQQNTVILVLLSFSFLEKACYSWKRNVSKRFLIEIYGILNGNNPCVGFTYFWVELD